MNRVVTDLLSPYYFHSSILVLDEDFIYFLCSSNRQNCPLDISISRFEILHHTNICFIVSGNNFVSLHLSLFSRLLISQSISFTFIFSTRLLQTTHRPYQPNYEVHKYQPSYHTNNAVPEYLILCNFGDGFNSKG